MKSPMKASAITTHAKFRSTTCLIFAQALFLLSFLPFAHAQSEANPFAPIVTALQNQDYAQALQLIHAAMQKFSQSEQLWTMQGIANARLGNTKEAMNSFRAALKISPDYIPALQNEVQIGFDAADPAVIPVLKHLLRLHPEDKTSHGMLAVLEYQQGNYADAVVHFEKSGQLFDAKVDALHAWAISLTKLKRFEEAAKVFQRAIALQPGDTREQQLLAAVQLMAHQPQNALATLQPLLHASNASVSQPGVETLDLAAAAYEDSGDTPQAVAILQQAILLEPQNLNLYLDFANISSAHDSYQVGINVVSDGITQLPKAAPLYLARGVLYIQLGQYDKAEADFDTAQELDPRQSLTIAAQGLLAAQQDDLGHALATVQAKLSQKPNDALLLYLQADFLSQQGVEPGSADFQLAMRSAKQAVTLQPNLSGARTVLAKLYLQDGKNREAVEECRKALERDPKDQTALYHLIQGLRKTGDKDEIPSLLKQLALLRKQAAHEQSERYRYKLVEDEQTK